jgi:uncharacterized protein YqcC (DUF446 family)
LLGRGVLGAIARVRVAALIDQENAKIIDALNQLEVGLRDLGLWSNERPTADALASTLPFCYDTLELEQWLQFIFLGRMWEILEQGDRLPDSCAIFPYIEMLSGVGKTIDPKLIVLIQNMDHAISKKSGSGERI